MKEQPYNQDCDSIYLYLYTCVDTICVCEYIKTVKSRCAVLPSQHEYQDEVMICTKYSEILKILLLET